MRKFIIEDDFLIYPFNEHARDLSILNKPLKIHHDEIISELCGHMPAELPLESIEELPIRLRAEGEANALLAQQGERVPPPDNEFIVYRDNLYFDREFFQDFYEQARATRLPSRAVLPADDPAWLRYAVPLSRLKPITNIEGNPRYYPLDLWYFPNGYVDRRNWREVPIYSGAQEKGYYNVPDSMSNLRADAAEDRDMDLTHLLTERSCLSIDSWVHVYFANIILGVFSRGSRFEERLARHNLFLLRVLFRAILEQKQVVSCSELVQVGRKTIIDPSATILGPTTIGSNCYIGPGVVIDNCIIGDNVNIAQGCQLMLSVVGNSCFLPFRAALFMTTLMEYTIVAQNTCLQMCVVGRNSFVGAGTTFTDFNMLPAPLRALDYDQNLSDTGQPVLGGCVGHNSRLGSGLIVMPGRVIESDVVLVASPERRVISKNITYEESDHHKVRASIAKLHRRRYPREVTDEALLDEWE